MEYKCWDKENKRITLVDRIDFGVFTKDSQGVFVFTQDMLDSYWIHRSEDYTLLKNTYYRDDKDIFIFEDDLLLLADNRVGRVVYSKRLGAFCFQFRHQDLIDLRYENSISYPEKKLVIGNYYEDYHLYV